MTYKDLGLTIATMLKDQLDQEVFIKSDAVSGADFTMLKADKIITLKSNWYQDDEFLEPAATKPENAELYAAKGQVVICDKDNFNC